MAKKKTTNADTKKIKSLESQIAKLREKLRNQEVRISSVKTQEIVDQIAVLQAQVRELKKVDIRVVPVVDAPIFANRVSMNKRFNRGSVSAGVL